MRGNSLPLTTTTDHAVNCHLLSGPSKSKRKPNATIRVWLYKTPTKSNRVKRSLSNTKKKNFYTLSVTERKKNWSGKIKHKSSPRVSDWKLIKFYSMENYVLKQNYNSMISTKYLNITFSISNLLYLYWILNTISNWKITSSQHRTSLT